MISTQSDEGQGMSKKLKLIEAETLTNVLHDIGVSQNHTYHNTSSAYTISNPPRERSGSFQAERKAERKAEQLTFCLASNTKVKRLLYPSSPPIEAAQLSIRPKP